MVRMGKTSVRIAFATMVSVAALSAYSGVARAEDWRHRNDQSGDQQQEQSQEQQRRDQRQREQRQEQDQQRQQQDRQRQFDQQRQQQDRQRQLDQQRQQQDRQRQFDQQRQQQDRQRQFDQQRQQQDRQRQFDQQRQQQDRQRQFDQQRQQQDRQRQFDQQHQQQDRQRQFDQQHQQQDRQRQFDQQRQQQDQQRQFDQRRPDQPRPNEAHRPGDRDQWRGDQQPGRDWRSQQQSRFEHDRDERRVRARREQEERWGDLRERNWSRVRDWGPGFQNREYYRGPDWDDWRRRHYSPRPRYDWYHDRYSRPWFDYGSVGYLSIFMPTYVIPYDAYDTYGSSYYGPVGCNRDVVGAVLGGAAGALIGSSHHGGAGATIGGAIVGAILGGALGQAIDMSDQACYGQVLEYVPNNQPVYWEDNGAQYQVTPLRTYQGDDGLYCREYQTEIYIDGYPQQAYGKACRQPDGSWQMSD